MLQIPPETKRKQLLSSMVNAFCLILSLLYIVLSSAALFLFDCSKQTQTGSYYLDGLPAKQCFGQWWKKRVPVAIVAIVIYVVGIPVGFVLLVFHGQRRLQPETFQRRFGAVVGKYKPAFAWWEPLIMVRKLAIVLCKVMFTSIPILQAIMALSVICVSTALHIHFHPMLERKINFLETVLLTCSAAILLAGILLDSTDFEGTQRTAVTALFVVVLAVACLVLLYSVASEIWFGVNNTIRKQHECLPPEELFHLFFKEDKFPLLRDWLDDFNVPVTEKAILTDTLRTFASKKEDNLLCVDPGTPLARAVDALSPPIHRLGNGWLNDDLSDICAWLASNPSDMNARFATLLASVSTYPKADETVAVTSDRGADWPGDSESIAAKILLTVFVPTLARENNIPLSAALSALLPTETEEPREGRAALASPASPRAVGYAGETSTYSEQDKPDLEFLVSPRKTTQVRFSPKMARKNLTRSGSQSSSS